LLKLKQLILIADCGGTKSDYAILNKDETIYFKGLGFNYTSSSKLVLPEELKEYLPKVQKAYLYIAGYTNNAFPNKIDLPDHISLNLYSDLEGVYRSTAGKQDGIICILGTGSSAAIFKNEKLFDKVPSLGYLLDNEGGGSHIGGMILKAYFSRMMPLEVKNTFEARFNTDYNEVLYVLYNKNAAGNLAKYSTLLTQVDKNWSKNILFDAFEKFFKYKIYPMDDWNQYPFYFCGGIAKTYEEELRGFLDTKACEVIKIIKSPIEGLVDFHKKNNT
jgi:N-acetylglucosamine kinase-like BadF-type ATPase